MEQFYLKQMVDDGWLEQLHGAQGDLEFALTLAWEIILNPEDEVYRIHVLDSAKEFVAEVWQGASGEAARGDSERYSELVEEMREVRDRMVQRNVANDLAGLQQSADDRIH